MTTEIREFYIKRVPVDVQERLTARDEAQVMLVMDSFAAHRTESDRAKIKALVEALESIERDNPDGCMCDHDTEDCCVRAGEFCPTCIAHAALALAGGE